MMRKIIGDVNSLAFGVGQPDLTFDNSQSIELWINGENITRLDSLAYMPAYYSHLYRELGKLKNESYFYDSIVCLNDEEAFQKLMVSGGVYYQVFSYDDSINSAIIYLVEESERCKLFYAFMDNEKGDLGEVSSLYIQKERIIETLELLLLELQKYWKYEV